jgi:hypothetical protein
MFIAPCQRFTNLFDRTGAVQSPCKAFMQCAFVVLVEIDLSADTGIGVTDILCMRGDTHAFDLLPNMFSATEAGVDHTQLSELFQCTAIAALMFTLFKDIALPLQAKPVKILNQSGGVFTPAPGVINILDTKDQFGIMFFCPLLAY